MHNLNLPIKVQTRKNVDIGIVSVLINCKERLKQAARELRNNSNYSFLIVHN